MNKKLLIFMLLYILILAEYVSSQSQVPDYICTQNLSISQSPLANLVREPLPYFIPYRNASCFRFGCVPEDFPLIPYHINSEIDSNINGTILYTKYQPIDKTIRNFRYNKSGIITFKDITILDGIYFCYIINNKTICKDNKNVVHYNRTLLAIEIGNRLDIFSTINFQTKVIVDAVCPLVFNFGVWSKTYLHPILKNEEWQVVKTDIAKQPKCTVPSSLSFPEVGIEGSIYNKTLILLGDETTSVIITKPENYYFVLDTENTTKVLVCTNDQTDRFGLISGINLFSFQGISDINKIGAMSFLFSLPSIKVYLEEPEIVIIKNFLIGNANPFDFTEPQITPSFEFYMEDKSYGSWQYLNFTYKDINGKHDSIVYPKNDKYNFEDTIILDGKSLYFPFLKYTATIQNNYPRKLSEKKGVPLSFKEGGSFQGYADFSKDGVNIFIYPKQGLIMWYVFTLIFSTIVFFVLILYIKYFKKSSFEPKQLLDLIGYFLIILSLILGSGFNWELLYSIGFIPHALYLIIFTILIIN